MDTITPDNLQEQDDEMNYLSCSKQNSYHFLIWILDIMHCEIIDPAYQCNSNSPNMKFIKLDMCLFAKYPVQSGLILQATRMSRESPHQITTINGRGGQSSPSQQT